MERSDEGRRSGPGATEGAIAARGGVRYADRVTRVPELHPMSAISLSDAFPTPEARTVASTHFVLELARAMHESGTPAHAAGTFARWTWAWTRPRESTSRASIYWWYWAGP